MREDVFALNQHSRIIVVAKDRLKLVGLNQHGVVFEKVIVKRCLHHDALSAYNREGYQHGKGGQHQPSVPKYPYRGALETSIYTFYFHCI